MVESLLEGPTQPNTPPSPNTPNLTDDSIPKRLFQNHEETHNSNGGRFAAPSRYAAGANIPMTMEGRERAEVMRILAFVRRTCTTRKNLDKLLSEIAFTCSLSQTNPRVLRDIIENRPLFSLDWQAFDTPSRESTTSDRTSAGQQDDRRQGVRFEEEDDDAQDDVEMENP